MDEDLKEELSNNETNHENLQKKLKQLKHSQGAYIGHITKTITKIDKFIIEKNYIEQIKYLEEQLEKNIKKLKIVIDEYCHISESPEQHDIMNECFLVKNARVLKAKNTIDNYICSQDINPLEYEMKSSQKSYAISIKSDLCRGSQKSNSSKNSQKSHLSSRSSNHYTIKVHQIKVSHQANLQLNLLVKNKQNSSKFKRRNV